MVVVHAEAPATRPAPKLTLLRGTDAAMPDQRDEHSHDDYLRCPHCDNVLGRRTDRGIHVRMASKRGGHRHILNPESIRCEKCGEPWFAPPAFGDVTVYMARLYADLVEQAHDAIWSWTVGGRITLFNPAAERLTGWTAAEAIGADIARILPEAYEGERRGIVEQLERGEPVAPYVTCRRRKDGTWLRVQVSPSPIRDTAGKLIGVSVIARPVEDEPA